MLCLLDTQHLTQSPKKKVHIQIQIQKFHKQLQFPPPK